MLPTVVRLQLSPSYVSFVLGHGTHNFCVLNTVDVLFLRHLKDDAELEIVNAQYSDARLEIDA